MTQKNKLKRRNQWSERTGKKIIFEFMQIQFDMTEIVILKMYGNLTNIQINGWML